MTTLLGSARVGDLQFAPTAQITLPPPVDLSPLGRYLTLPGARRPGFYVSANGVTTAKAWSLEGSRGSVVKPDLKAYYSMSSGSIPMAAHKTAAEEGHPAHCMVALNGPTTGVPARGIPAPATVVNGKGIWTYQQVTSGALDGFWTWLANQLKAVNGLIIFSLNIEPENKDASTGRRESFSNWRWYEDRATLGNTAVRAILREYASAYRYVRAKLDSLGVDNVIYSMNFAALGYVSSWHNDNVYPSLWPGDDVVDILGWDPYVNNPESQSLLQKLQPTLNYLRGGGLSSSNRPSLRVNAGMPWHLPEFGATPTSNTAVINWINQVPATLQAVPEIRALSWYSSEGTEGTTIHTIAPVRAAYAEMCSHPIFVPSEQAVH